MINLLFSFNCKKVFQPAHVQACLWQKTDEVIHDKKRRYRIYKANEFFKVILQQYHEESDCMGYIEPAGFYEVQDKMVHHVGTIDEGISVGRELMRNI